MLLSIAGFVLSTSAPASRADDDDDDDDHEEARAAVKRGEAVPLAELMPIVGAAVAGEVIGVEIDRDDGMLVYEFKVLTPQGDYYKVDVDAKSKRVLNIERQ